MGPVLNQEDADVVLSLTTELKELCDAHGRFADTPKRELTAAAGDFSRYRFKSMDAAKRPTKDARRFSLDDLRRVAKKGFPDIAFILELFDHLPVNTPVGRPGGEIRCA